MSVLEWCEYFYGQEMEFLKWQDYAEPIYKKLKMIDSKFSSVRLDPFMEEYEALCLEVIGLAWQLHKGEIIATTHAELTDILVSPEIWENSLKYNVAIKSSVEMYYKMKAQTGIEDKRSEVASSLHTTNPDHVSRIVNRVNASEPWRNFAPQSLLAPTFAKSLVTEANQATQSLIAEEIDLFFKKVGKTLMCIQVPALDESDFEKALNRPLSEGYILP